MQAKRYQITIEGVGSLIHDQLSRQLIKEISQLRKEEYEAWEDENWERKTYKNENGEYIIPDENIKSALIESTTFYGKPPKIAGRTWKRYIKSSILIEQHAPLTTPKPTPYGRMVNGNPSSGGKSSKVWKVRPRFNEWTAQVTLLDVQGVTTKEDVKDWFTKTGAFVGICNARPQFGRFRVKDVKEQKVNL